MIETSPLLVVDRLRVRSRQDIFDLLASLGFSPNSGSWLDAELGQDLIFKGLIPDGEVYHRLCRLIAEYFGL